MFGYYSDTSSATINMDNEAVSVGTTTGVDYDEVQGKRSVLKATVNTADTTLANERAGLVTKIEGHDINHLGWGTDAGVSITVSFYVTVSLAGWYSFAVRNGNALTHSYIHDENLAANTRTKVTFTVPKPPAGSVWESTNLVGLDLLFDLGSDTPGAGTASAPPDAWQVSNSFVSNANTPANWIGTAASTYILEEVQIEVGATATPFERRPYTEELELCQRYYEKSYPQAVDPGTANSVGSMTHRVTGSQKAFYGSNIKFSTTKRATPTMTVYSTNSGTVDKVYRLELGSDFAVNFLVGMGENSGGNIWLVSNRADGEGLEYHWVADAEL
jgi:hypothetical protein